MRRIEIEIDSIAEALLNAKIDDAAPTLEAATERILRRAVISLDMGESRGPCECGLLERAANDPNSGVEFDKTVNEYGIVKRFEGGGYSSYVVRHCFSCGGHAPESLRGQLFARADESEQRRLTELCCDVRTFSDAIERFGEPESDHPTGQSSETTLSDGQPVFEFSRVIIYTNLSDVVDVHFVQRIGDLVSVSFMGKYIGPPAPPIGSV